jgi:hypothetical protein
MTMMSTYSQAFDEHAGVYQSGLQVHQLAIEAAPDVATMNAIENQHALDVQSQMTNMRSDVGDMMTCTGPSGQVPASQQVYASLDQLQQECDAHRSAMAAATDVSSALSEETRHQGQMTTIMADMQMHESAMMNGAADYSCLMMSGGMGMR